MALGGVILHYLTSIRRVFGPSIFFHPQLWGWLQGLVFADQRNCFRGSHSALFDVDSTGFWTIDFFNPKFEGGYRGKFSPIKVMALGGVILHCLTSIRRVFGPSIFFNPQLWGWLQGVVGVLHPSYYDHKSLLGGYYKCRWVRCKSVIYTWQRSLVRGGEGYPVRVFLPGVKIS